jgi:parallel beta-helix repeat protein
MGIGRQLPAILGMTALAALIQCSGNGTGSSDAPSASSEPPAVQPSSITVRLNPASTNLEAGSSTTVIATVSGTTNTGLTWSVDGVANGNESVGRITGQGSTITYTAPNAAGNHILTATSVADPAKSDSSSLVVAPIEVPPIPIVSVNVTPSATSIATSAVLALSVTVSGSTDASVTWTVDDIVNGNASVGTISGTGNQIAYTAPSASGSRTITATSNADRTKKASAKVEVQNACAPAPASPLSVSVKDVTFGAKGDGKTDDTAAIQKAVNAVAGTGGTVFIPGGTYLVNAVFSNNRGIVLKSNMTLRMAPDTILKALPNASQNYAVLVVDSAKDLSVIGGTIEGERGAHTGSGGEWGMGILFKHAERVIIQDLTARECWGDGFCVTDQSADITFCGVTADHNRRQGLSIISVDGMVIRNSTFKNTAGTLPEDGIDIEPNAGQTVNNVLITSCSFLNNAGDGLEDGVPGKHTGVAFVYNVVVDGNTFSGNGRNSLSTSPRCGIEITNTSGHRIINNQVKNNAGYGILLRNGTTGVTVAGNTVTGNAKNGILMDSSTGNTLTGNIVSSNGVAP